MQSRDDHLFEAQRKNRENKKRKLIMTIAIAVVAVIVIVSVGANALKKKVNEQMGGAKDEVLSAEVTVGNISTTVSGSGTLEAVDVENYTVPSSVEIVDYYVEAGDRVEKGDLIATVTNASLLTAMSDMQKEINDLDDKIADAIGDKVSETISASTTGRVKVIYAAAGDDVATVVYDHGALMLLSLDGYMAVDVTTDALTAGQSVSVTLSDSTVVSGTVEKIVNGVATILVTDNGTSYEDAVTVHDGNGTTYGTGSLYIHSQMMITGYAGTVSSVSVSVNDKVSAGTTLLKLKDTETSASYDALLKERAELEAQLNTLVRIYKEGGICATITGVVDSAESTTEGDSMVVASVSADTNMSISISVDETDILSIAIGQEVTVSIDSIGDETYTGTVTKVNKTATSTSGVTYYTAEVQIEKTEDMLSGMSASVVVTIEGSENALLIPIDALHQSSSSSYVYTTYDESTGEYGGKVEVTTGLSNSTYVEITSGLSEGDVVYYTEAEENSFGNMFGNMGGFGGGSFPGGSSGSGMPDFGGSSGMPGGSGGSGMPSMPGGGF